MSFLTPHFSLRSLNANHSVNKVPHLGLRPAAANGNICLAKYALLSGQPINPALDCVLPLHTTSSGGNDLAVKLLVEPGVNGNSSR